MGEKAILPVLLSDQLLNEFDAVHWSSPQNDESAKFVEKAFPVLATYCLGTELDKLVKGYRWLSDLAIPAKRLKSARIFQKNPARNLGILDVFIKLQFLKVWGSSLIGRHTFCCIFYEMFKIVEAERQAELVEAERQAKLAKISSQSTEIVAESVDPRHEIAGKYGSIIEAHDLERKVETLQQDFGDRWKIFVEK